MKELKFKVKFDNELGGYYFTPFKNNRDYYVWLSDIIETNYGLYAITEYGGIKVKEFNYNYVIVEVN